MNTIIKLFICFFILSCSKIQVQDSYQIYIDQDIPDINRKWILDSLLEWKKNTSLKYNVVDVKFTNKYNKNFDEDNSIHITYKDLSGYNTQRVGGLTNRVADNNSSYIYFDDTVQEYYDKQKFVGIALHELGHAFGVGHTDEYHVLSVMVSHLKSPYKSTKLECIDIIQYCDLWSCKVNCQ